MLDYHTMYCDNDNDIEQTYSSSMPHLVPMSDCSAASSSGCSSNERHSYEEMMDDCGGVEVSIPCEVIKEVPTIDIMDTCTTTCSSSGESFCHEAEEQEHDQDQGHLQQLVEEIEHRRVVSFGQLEIRSYPVILGDHPECSVGPPLTIGWEPFKRSECSIDEYETTRPSRRSRFDLMQPWMERKRLIRRTSSASDEEIRAVMMESQRIRKQRARSLYMTHFEFLELRFEAIKRKLFKPKRSHI